MAENKQYITQVQENGSVKISEDVISTIVAHAVEEVEGVVSLNVKPGADIADLIGKKNWGKGMKIAIVARVQTGSYKGNDGKMVYTTDFVIEEQEFCESKGSNEQSKPAPSKAIADGFMTIPDDCSDEGLPFN